MDLSRPLEVIVCGNGSIGVFEDGELQPHTMLTLRVDEDGMLVDQLDRPIAGALSNGVDFDAVWVDLNDSPITPTTAVSVEANLDSRTLYVGPFDERAPAATSVFSTAVSLVGPVDVHRVELYFTHNGEGRWELWAMAELEVAGCLESLGHGTLSFDTDGNLAETMLPRFDAPWKASPVPRWSLTGVFTSHATSSAVTALHVDGVKALPIFGLGLTARGEVFTTDAAERQHAAAWILDGLDAYLAPVESH